MPQPGGRAMPWSAEEMLDGQRQRVDIPAMPGLLTMASRRKDWKMFFHILPWLGPIIKWPLDCRLTPFVSEFGQTNR